MWSRAAGADGAGLASAVPPGEQGDLGILRGLLDGQGVTGALDHSKIEGAISSARVAWARNGGAGSWISICDWVWSRHLDLPA